MMSTDQATILIATSHTELYMFLRGLFPESQAVVWKASNAADAETILRRRPTAAVIDYELPGSQTSSFINCIHDSLSQFPIVFCHCSRFSHSELWIVQNLFRVNLVVQNLFPLLVSQRQQFGDNLDLPPTSVIEALSGLPAPFDVCKPDSATDLHARLQNTKSVESAGSQTEALNDEEETDAAIEAVSISYLLELPEVLCLLKEQVLRAMLRNDIDLLEQVGRVCHQICGTAGSFGFMGISRLAHRVEEIIEPLCRQDRDKNSETADTENLREIVQLVGKMTELTAQIIRTRQLASVRMLGKKEEVEREVGS